MITRVLVFSAWTEAVKSHREFALISLLFVCVLLCNGAAAQTLDRETLATKIEPPNELGDQLSDNGVWSIRDRGVPYGAANQDGSGQIYLDGVTKATASVRIAHESILAASLAVAREHVQGLAGGPSPRPKRGEEGAALDWNDLVKQGIATRRVVTNSELQAAFDDSLWEDDDAEALSNPEGNYMDLWVIDIGPDTIARAVLDDDTLAERDELLSIADHSEPLLLLANGRHGFVSEEFVPNTSPDLLLAEQNGLEYRNFVLPRQLLMNFLMYRLQL